MFGAPERLADHADRALRGACEIVEAVGRRFGGEVRVGMGLNSGPVVVGSVGGGGRLEFAVIGDPVNVAARVEEATRETGDACCSPRPPAACSSAPRRFQRSAGAR